MKTRIFKKLPEGSCVRVITSPVGPLYLVAGDEALHAIIWECDLEKPVTAATIAALPRAPMRHKVLDATEAQLRDYFDGERQSFDLPLAPAGTDFQRAAWFALLDIPYGETTSYEAQAIRLGGREKVRAVGTANGMNPISIIMPCHRVVGKNGSLTGFGGGLKAKAFLLEHEARTAGLTLC